MNKIRTFIAIDIDKVTRENIQDFVKQLTALPVDVKWVRKENIHITIKFLGNIYVSEHDKIYRAMKMVTENSEEFKLQIRGTGVFPNIRSARVLWIGTGGEVDKLKEFHRQLEDVFAQNGFPRDEKDFSPHLTIGRVRSGRNIDKLIKILEDAKEMVFGEVLVRSVNVMRSELRPAGPEYFLLKEIKFGKIE